MTHKEELEKLIAEENSAKRLPLLGKFFRYYNE